MSTFSHLDEHNRPGMVDVGAKPISHRTARARARVTLPPAVSALLSGGELNAPKGPVFQTAVLAGTMAAKKTGDLIPLCHPIGLDSCKLDIHMDGPDRVVIEALCEVRHRTGVEMEALTAVTVAALTVYDMCKGVSRDMVIEKIELLDKTGGRSGERPEERPETKSAG